MVDDNKTKDKSWVIGTVAIVSIVAIFFGFMGFSKSSMTFLQLPLGSESDLVGQPTAVLSAGYCSSWAVSIDNLYGNYYRNCQPVNPQYSQRICDSWLRDADNQARNWSISCAVSCIERQLFGDITNDGRVTRLDSIVLSSMIVNRISTPQNIACCADLTMNGQFNSLDAQRVLRIGAGVTEVPNRRCGDPEPELRCVNGQKRGDADGDGRILDYDADLILQTIAGNIEVPADGCCIDVNNDGVLNQRDARRILDGRRRGTPEPNFGVCGAATTTRPQTSTIPSCYPGQRVGDADGDGRITNTDVNLISEISSGRIRAPRYACCADVNQNGAVDAADYNRIRTDLETLTYVPIYGTCTESPLVNEPFSVGLYSAQIIGQSLRLIYFKNFATCAHIINESISSAALQSACYSGLRVQEDIPLNSLSRSVSVGQRLRLCHGNDRSICSELVTIA